jgi:DNA repair protein RadC
MPSDLSGAGHRERLRSRYFQAGLRAFAPHEIIEVALTLAIPRGDVKPLAKDLCAQFGSIRGILNASYDELLAVSGVGPNTIFALHFIRDLIPECLADSLAHSPSPTTPEHLLTSLADIWRTRLGHEKKEVFEVALISPSFALLRIVTHSRGTTDQATVFPSEVMRSALKADAYALAFAHNHPSGDPSPSDADKFLTRQLVLAATATRLHVIDHLIITPDTSFSFRKTGLL